MITEQQILQALESIKDPELQFSIVKLGMIDGAEIDGSQVKVSLKLPLPGSPGEKALIEKIGSTVSGLEGVSDTQVAVSLMTDAERLDLANRIHGRAEKSGAESATESGGSSGSNQISEKAVANAAPLALDADGKIAETDTKRRQVAEALETVEDPEIHLPLTALGMIKHIGIGDDDVAIEVTLTVPGCPLKDKITNDVTTALKKHDWVRNVGIQFGVMTEEQRQQVAEIVRGTGREQPAAWSKESAEELAKRVIVVCSGKGGVGKSTTTTNLAFALAGKGYQVGILDADVYGFSIPRMTGIHGQPLVVGEKLEPIAKGNLQVMSMGYFIDEDAPVIWRGPLLHKAIKQFLEDVNWRNLDYLFFDLPPGTGDVTLTIAQALPNAEMLIVTTPQPVATHVAGRVAALAERAKISVLGVIENMSYYEKDGKRDYIFGKGGGKELAEKLGVPFLGEIPLNQLIRECSDSGKPITLDRDQPIATPYFEISERITNVEAPLISVKA